MSQLSAWQDILERLGTLDGPDRKLDSSIMEAAGQFPAPHYRSFDYKHITPELTASTDCAIALARARRPDIHCIDIDIAPTGEFGVELLTFFAGGKSLPLAILTALARAEIARLEAE